MIKGPYIEVSCDGNNCGNVIEVKYIKNIDHLPYMSKQDVAIEKKGWRVWEPDITNSTSDNIKDQHYCPDCRGRYEGGE